MEGLSECRREIEDIDQDMADLFYRRMSVSRRIAQVKRENGMPVKDAVREEELLRKNMTYISDPAMKPYYEEFMKTVFTLSCRSQEAEVEEKP